jgi:tetratricopeptide (TPR) repeat protein
MGYVGLANYYWGEVQLAEIPAEVGMPKAKEYLAKALEVDPYSAEAYTILGFVRFLYDWDWEASERAYKKAIALNPSYAETYRWYGSLLGVQGRHEEAIEATETAWRLDPVSPLNACNAAARYFYAGRYDRALDICYGLLESDPDFWMTHWVIGWCYSQLGRHEEAVEEFKQTLEGVGFESLFRVGCAYALAGRREEAMDIIRQFDEAVESQYIPAYYYAAIYGSLNDADKAFYYLDKAFEERHLHVVWEVTHPKYDGIRDDPRWKDHLKRLNLD